MATQYSTVIDETPRDLDANIVTGYHHACQEIRCVAASSAR
jgi:hypothetical protein